MFNSFYCRNVSKTLYWIQKVFGSVCVARDHAAAEIIQFASNLTEMFICYTKLDVYFLLYIAQVV